MKAVFEDLLEGGEKEMIRRNCPHFPDLAFKQSFRFMNLDLIFQIALVIVKSKYNGSDPLPEINVVSEAIEILTDRAIKLNLDIY